MDNNLNGEVLATVPFLYKKIHNCKAIMAMPISFNFSSVMLQCMDYSLGVRSFDLLGIPAFSKNFLSESNTVLETLKLSIEKHNIELVTLFQHVDFHNGGRSTRFDSGFEEDYFHKKGLIASMLKIRRDYPKKEVRAIYARLIRENTEVELVEVFDNGKESVRMVAPYWFRGVYKCEAVLVLCLDFRFRKESRLCIRDSFKIQALDLVGIPGSAQSFLKGAMVSWKALKVAIERHGCKTVYILQHADCGAYKGIIKSLNGFDEEIFQRNQMYIFEHKILKKYPHVRVVKVYARLIDNDTKIQFVRFD
ncbi:MAG: carbonic anhydrase [Candidatus Moraniibacteriota bacterium]